MTLERGVSEGLLRDAQLTSFSAGMTKLVEALGGMHKVDTMVLPFPYAQLLRWSLLIFCFTLPFVISTELDWWTVPLCMFITCVFYGLDEVGAELEQPFGVDPNDFPLIRMGDSLADDLDVLLRTANQQRVHMRHTGEPGGGRHTAGGGVRRGGLMREPSEGAGAGANFRTAAAHEAAAAAPTSSTAAVTIQIDD